MVGAVLAELRESLSAATTAGVAAESMVLDPGLGFSKTVEQSVALFDQLPALHALGRPLLVGPSRKRFLGAITGLPVEERDRATAAACALALGAGRAALPGPRRRRRARGAGGGARARGAAIPVIAPDDRPPYRAALAVGATVLAVFVLTLAPTVTFWDAGEFIAAARILGIPHPPATPLFVLLAHVWGLLVPIGEWAYRTNLLSAVFSASAAGLFFLAIHQSLRGAFTDLPESTARLLRVGGAAAAAMIGAFSFTNWQNSNETEVYTVATFTTAAMAWTAVLWRSRRESRARASVSAADPVPGRALHRQPSARAARGARRAPLPGRDAVPRARGGSGPAPDGVGAGRGRRRALGAAGGDRARQRRRSRRSARCASLPRRPSPRPRARARSPPAAC